MQPLLSGGSWSLSLEHRASGNTEACCVRETAVGMVQTPHLPEYTSHTVLLTVTAPLSMVSSLCATPLQGWI